MGNAWTNCRLVVGLGTLSRLFDVRGDVWAFFGDASERAIVRAKLVPGDPTTFVDHRTLSLRGTPEIKGSAALCVDSLVLHHDVEERPGTDRRDVLASCYDEATLPLPRRPSS